MEDTSGTKEKIIEMIVMPYSNTVSLSELEAEITLNLRQAGREMLQCSLEELEERSPAPSTRCRWCGKEARYLSNRVGFVSTGYGQIRYRRAYYVCRHCGRSTCPLDERLKPYESLARLRARLEAGISLPVDELASAWGLGSLECEFGENLVLDSGPSEISTPDHSKALPVENCCTSA